MKTILVLGGYGNFGKRIVEDLSSIESISILVAGRNLTKAQQLIQQLDSISNAELKAVELDITADSFAGQLDDLSPDIVIHTSGPFQNQHYQVPQACIKAGAHYIDLADDRRFVCDIGKLHKLALEQNVLVVSGASSVPGLSGAVIDHYLDEFESIETIDIAIAPGNKAERGEATVRGILSYTGHPFSVLKNKEQTNAYGWMDARKLDFGDVIGKRWLANVDVPDLELFPARYSVKERVSFQAGLELSVLHLTMVCMAFLSKIKLIKDWSVMTGLIMKTSNLFSAFGTDIGGMNVSIKGAAVNGISKEINWTLYAPGGVGPYIPTLSAILVARKLLNGSLTKTGATPCQGLFALSEFESFFKAHGIYAREVSNG